jgi:hypothetical protein
MNFWINNYQLLLYCDPFKKWLEKDANLTDERLQSKLFSRRKYDQKNPCERDIRLCFRKNLIPSLKRVNTLID